MTTLKRAPDILCFSEVFLGAKMADDASSDSDADRVVLSIAGQKYDVTDYIPSHPGEGHNDIYLEDYAGKDVTKEFEYFHSKLDKPVPQNILEKVRDRGQHKKIFLVDD